MNRTIGLLLALAGWAGSTVTAQGTCSASLGTKCATIVIASRNAASLTNPKLMQLTMSPAATSLAITEAEITAGATVAKPVVLTVRSNRPWTVALSGASTWVVTGIAWAAKPIGDLRWAPVATGNGSALTTSPVPIATGEPTASSSTTIYLHARLGWASDSPGGYALGVTFTLSTP
jgi:hypothetical protein